MRDTSSLAGAVLVVVALVAACGAPPRTTPSVDGPVASVPAVPAPATRSFGVEPSLVERLACDACAESDPPDAPRFFYGVLPARSVDALFAGSAGDRAAHLGNLFLSGWFGGLYLRDNLGPPPRDAVAAADPALPLAGDPVRDALLAALGSGTISALDEVVGGLVRTAERGSRSEVRNTALLLGPLMAAVHGYNLGYLQVALENPPPGAPPAAGLGCDPAVDPVFDCRAAGLSLAALDALDPTLGRLGAPPDAAWDAWSHLVTDVALDSVTGGRAVWERLLDGSGFAPDGYAAIVELSRGFLQVTQAAVLSLSEAAVGDAEVGRRGLVVSAALLLWAGSYFAGLAAPGSAHDLPALDCDAHLGTSGFSPAGT